MAVVTPPPEATLPQRLRFWARSRPDRVAFRQKDFGIWQPYTWPTTTGSRGTSASG